MIQAIKYRLLSLYLLCIYMWVQKRIEAQLHKGTSNDRNELTSSSRYIGNDISNTGNPVPEEDRTYNYDPIGNRTTAISDQITSTYTANELNQYTEQSITNQGAPASYTYDLDGNMTNISNSDGIKKYTYNAENRLIAVEPENPENGDTKTENIYDFMGRRIKKTVSAYDTGSWQLEKEILFAYDGWNMIKETITDQSIITKHYIWGLDLSQSLQGAGGVGGLLAVTDGSFTYLYNYDGNGNAGQLIDSADGSIEAHYEYEPYGNLITSSGDYADQNSYRFSTKYFDEGSNLYYYGYRFYNPEIGRWINKDPIEEIGGDNVLSFINNNPINKTDYLGLIPPIVINMIKNCSKSVFKAFAKKTFDKWFNMGVACNKIYADMKLKSIFDDYNCSKDYPLPYHNPPLINFDINKEIFNCVLGNLKGEVLDRIIPDATKRKLIDKLIDETQGEIEKALDDNPPITKFRLSYGCISGEKVGYKVMAVTTFKMLDEPLESVVIEGNCGVEHPKSVVRRECCLCIYPDNGANENDSSCFINSTCN